MVKVDVKGCCGFVDFVDGAKYDAYVGKALDAFDVLVAGNGAGNDFLGWKHLPSETPESLIADCEAIRDDWKAKGVDLVIAIGIGGSYLGAKCAIEALSHNFAKQLAKKDAAEVVFAGNNLSEEYLAELMDLAAERNVACIVISKSGTTTEPAVAFRIVEGYKTFVVPDNVGGRFSVLTPVGILPIVVAGFDVRAILAGALEAEKALAVKSAENPAVVYAAMRNLLYKEYGKKVEILVNYKLYGESEGKDGVGIFPASVNNTADLHSMGQFIQEGDRVMFETVVHVEKATRSVVIGSDPQNLDQLNYLAGKPVEHCNHMAELGTVIAHQDGGVPQLQVCVEQVDAFNLGSLFYFFEFACGVSAYTLGVNPFNQPGVEAYKKNMFALLEKPGYEEATKAIKARL